MNNQRRRSSAGIFVTALLSGAAMLAGTVEAAPTPSMDSLAPPTVTFSDPFSSHHFGKRAGSNDFWAKERLAPRDLTSDTLAAGAAALNAILSPTSSSSAQASPSAQPSSSSSQDLDCLPAGTTDNDISKLFYNGGPGFKVSLCPSTTYYLTDTITMWNADQELSTAGYPVDDTRAMLVVTGQDQAAAVFTGCDLCHGASIKNIQINGNRPALGMIKKGAALIESGGISGNQTIQNSHIFEPRGWSALHVAEGPGNACAGMQVLSNQIGPAGNAPNSAKQYKRDLTAYREYMSTPAHELAKRDVVAPGEWADGISLSCANAVVSGNTITDATDGSIVIFGSPGSDIHSNTIIAQKRVALGGINAVDFNPWGGDYSNVQVRDNSIQTQGSMIKIGIAIGGMSWGSDNNPALQTKNGKFVNNTFQSTDGYFGYGISVAGHQNAFTQANNFDAAKFNLAYSDACIPHLMPPTAQALIRDPATSYGGFQRVTQTDTLAFLVCVMPVQYASQPSKRDVEETQFIDDRPAVDVATNADLSKAAQPLVKEDAPFDFPTGKLEARTTSAALMVARDEPAYTRFDVEIVPAPSAKRALEDISNTVAGFFKRGRSNSTAQRRERPWIGGRDSHGRLAFDKRSVLQQDSYIA